MTYMDPKASVLPTTSQRSAYRHLGLQLVNSETHLNKSYGTVESTTSFTGIRITSHPLYRPLSRSERIVYNYNNYDDRKTGITTLNSLIFV